LGNEEESEQLKFEQRNDQRPNPMIIYSVRGIPNSRVHITLHPDRPLIDHVDLMGNDPDMERIIAAVDDDLGIKLADAEPHP